MSEAAGPAPQSLGAIQARLDQQIPQLYRDLALYLQVLRDVLPASLDQAGSHLATQVNPQAYNRLHPAERAHLHSRLKVLMGRCSSFLTVEQLLNLATQMAHERQRLAQRDQTRFLDGLSAHERPSSGLPGAMGSDPLPMGSIQLQLRPPLGEAPFPSPLGPSSPTADQQDEGTGFPFSGLHFSAEMLAALEDPSFAPEVPWSSGQLPRDPVSLLQCLEAWDIALSRRLRNLSHSVNLEMARAGLMVAAVPVPLLDAVLAGQIEPQGAPANLLRLPLAPQGAAIFPHPPMGVLLRTVDLELEQPRLRTCRRRLLHHRQEIHKMAETAHRLQRRLQAHHAQRLWRHDSQLNPPKPQA
ncbi:MAG: hypothetical protein ACOVQK_01060 [Cyanobium sp.]